MAALGGIPMRVVKEEYPGNLISFVTVTCIFAAMGGLIFGYDIGVSVFPISLPEENLDRTTNQYCKYDSQILTMFTSSMYLAALLSSLVASTVTRKFGRKLSMLFGGLLFLIGALINGFAQHVWMLILGRIFLGFGIGFANQVQIMVSDLQVTLLL
ncbi:sugar transporter [Medicago truncatula]|uniref:Sugar transporter n=1 Tax=Medicago truncatula TaxID=3880 RepID=A0A072TJ95_MEDTR|nr:sugar transporter [Medicago truncatula]